MSTATRVLSHTRCASTPQRGQPTVGNDQDTRRKLTRFV
jgi:hypothetical protein